jgi:hypothetical protein
VQLASLAGFDPERAFAEASARPLLSLAEIFRKIAEDATTVHQFHSLQKSLE